MAEDGRILSTDPMPVDDSGVCRVGVAELYRKYQLMVNFDEPVNVFIEKIFTKPTDAVSTPVLKGIADVFKAVNAYMDALEGGYAEEDHIVALRAVSARLKGDLRGQDLAKLRPDGRVGMLNYAKGAGILQCCAMLGWPISEVMPRTWAKVIKDGAPGALNSKEQSYYVAKNLWPDLFKDGKPAEGPLEACLIAEYGRRLLSRKSA